MIQFILFDCSVAKSERLFMCVCVYPCVCVCVTPPPLVLRSNSLSQQPEKTHLLMTLVKAALCVWQRQFILFHTSSIFYTSSSLFPVITRIRIIMIIAATSYLLCHLSLYKFQRLDCGTSGLTVQNMFALKCDYFVYFKHILAFKGSIHTTTHITLTH